MRSKITPHITNDRKYMIKVCSLDFLNKEVLETDIMEADGKVLLHAGEKLTSGIILRLYFKEIYVDESYIKEQEEIEAKIVAANVTTGNPISEAASKFAETANEEEKVLVGPRSVKTNAGVEETPVLSGPRSVDTSAEIEEKTDDLQGPRHIETDIEEEKSASSGPRSIETSAVEIDKNKSHGHAFVAHSPTEKIEPEIKEDPENAPLTFDEKLAKRIVEHSVKLGKMLNFSGNELKELEQVAYYCNIGITKLKKSDLTKKEFRKMKAYASYEKLLNEVDVPEKIAEMVKFSANNYQSDTFPLNSKIPYHHIVSLTSFYEELLAKTNSKQRVLSKMLQIGGNQFNIFILHKFLKMMRETND